MFKKLSLELTVFSVIVLMAFAGFVSLQGGDNELTGEQVLVPPPGGGGVKSSVPGSGSVLVTPKPTTSTTIIPCSGPKGEKGFAFPSNQNCPAGYGSSSFISSQAKCCYQSAATSVVTTQPKVDPKFGVCRMVTEVRSCGKQAYAAGNDVQGACCASRFRKCKYGTKTETGCGWGSFWPGKYCSQACPGYTSW